MSYYPENNYNERISYYESLLESVSDIDGIEIPTDDDNERTVKGIEKDIDNTVKSIKNIASDLLSLLQSELVNAYNLAMDNYVESINENIDIPEKPMFPFKEWVRTVEFKEKNSWVININWLNPIKYIKIDSEEKREIILLNVWQYWQQYKENNETYLKNGLKEIKIFLDKFNDEKMSKFYDHLLYGSPLEYVVELRGKIQEAKLDKWHQEAFLGLSLNWQDVEKRNEILESYGSYLKSNPEQKEYLNGLLMDVFFNKSFNGDSAYIKMKASNNGALTIENISYSNILDFVHLDIKHKFGYQDVLMAKLAYLDKQWYTSNKKETYQDFLSIANPLYLAAKLDDSLPNNKKEEKKVKI